MKEYREIKKDIVGKRRNLGDYRGWIKRVWWFRQWMIWAVSDMGSSDLGSKRFFLIFFREKTIRVILEK